MLRCILVLMAILTVAAPALAACPSPATASGAEPPFSHPSGSPVTRLFGPYLHPLLQETRQHSGIDYGTSLGDPVSSAGDGVVKYAGRRGYYGTLIVIDHGRGLETAYAHLSRVDVGVGSCVSQGDLIGGAGSTGLTSGTALHFEISRNEKPVDPLPLLAPGHAMVLSDPKQD